MATSDPIEQDTNARPKFEVRDHVSAGRHTLMLSGELDMAHAEVLETMVVRVCAEGVASLSLDLSGLTFIDSSGIRAILGAQQICAEHGYEYLLTPGAPAVQRVFELTGLVDTLPFIEAA